MGKKFFSCILVCMCAITFALQNCAKVIAPFLIPSNKKEWFGNGGSEEPMIQIRTATANGIATDGAQTLQGAD